MKYLLVPFLALGVGTAAIASTGSMSAPSGSYPACSKTVTDECTEAAAGQAHHASAKDARAAHHRSHRHAAGKTD